MSSQPTSTNIRSNSPGPGPGANNNTIAHSNSIRPEREQRERGGDPRDKNTLQDNNANNNRDRERERDRDNRGGAGADRAPDRGGSTANRGGTTGGGGGGGGTGEGTGAGVIERRNPQNSQQQISQGVGSASASGSSSDFQSDEEYAWIPWYCSLKGNELFSEVDEEYAQDSFNLTGLASLVPNFDQALDLILDVEPNPNEMLSDDQQEMIENDAETLFGLIHARYILTSRGMQSMLDKYRSGDFGRCPRVLCDGQTLLPIGLSDQPNQHPVKLYCPRCDEIYHTTNTRHQHIDGAYFGTTFSHLFLLTYPELKAQATATPKATYVPRVFGFKIHKNAYQRALNDKNKFNAMTHNNPQNNTSNISNQPNNLSSSINVQNGQNTSTSNNSNVNNLNAANIGSSGSINTNANNPSNVQASQGSANASANKFKKKQNE